MAGVVFLKGERISRTDKVVDEEAPIEVRGNLSPTSATAASSSSRRLTHFGLDIVGKTAVDIGSSTGGFVDCLLQAGASRVTQSTRAPINSTKS